jgi:chitodextrinase
LNCSAATSVNIVKTTDSVAPTAPESLRIVKVTGNAINVAWNAATDNIAVDGYRVFVNGSPRTTVKGTVANIKNLSPNTQYTITVRAFDQQKNNSANGTALTVTTGATAGTIVDVDAPTSPVNLVSENVSMFGFALKWTAASDNVGVKEYEVYRNGKLHGKTAHPAFHFRNMAPGRNSNVQVIAVDHAGNKSTISDSIDVMTVLGNALLDISAPQTPSNLSSSDVTSSGFKVSWTASEDDVFTFGYNVYLNGVYVASVGGTSYTFSGLSMTSAHNVQILAYDMAKNRSAKSTSLSVVNP